MKKLFIVGAILLSACSGMKNTKNVNNDMKNSNIKQEKIANNKVDVKDKKHSDHKNSKCTCNSEKKDGKCNCNKEAVKSCMKSAKSCASKTIKANNVKK